MSLYILFLFFASVTSIYRFPSSLFRPLKNSICRYDEFSAKLPVTDLYQPNITYSTSEADANAYPHLWETHYGYNILECVAHIKKLTMCHYK